jgi:phage FluMu protein gp41
MVKEYDVELLRRKCAEVKEAAEMLSRHELPEWLSERLAKLAGEAATLECALEDGIDDEHSAE